MIIDITTKKQIKKLIEDEIIRLNKMLDRKFNIIENRIFKLEENIIINNKRYR